MAGLGSTGSPTISNIAAPTTTELNAGTNLTSLITPDGVVGFEPDTADVDVSALDSTFDTKVAGRGSFSGTMLRLKKQAGTDAVYNLLVRDLAGYVVIRRDVTSSTAWATNDKAEVYPSVLGEVRNLPPASERGPQVRGAGEGQPVTEPACHRRLTSG
jgi:hypothetical protein